MCVSVCVRVRGRVCVQVLIFLSGMLDNAEVAVGVTGLALQFSTLVWLAAASIGSATSTRVANKVRVHTRHSAHAAVRCSVQLTSSSARLLWCYATEPR